MARAKIGGAFSDVRKSEKRKRKRTSIGKSPQSRPNNKTAQREKKGY